MSTPRERNDAMPKPRPRPTQNSNNDNHKQGSWENETRQLGERWRPPKSKGTFQVVIRLQTRIRLARVKKDENQIDACRFIICLRVEWTPVRGIPKRGRTKRRLQRKSQGFADRNKPNYSCRRNSKRPPRSPLLSPTRKSNIR